MSKNSITVTLKRTKMGWCVYLNREVYAVGSHEYCQEVSRSLILRALSVASQGAA
jgi:hypothetical protein